MCENLEAKRKILGLQIRVCTGKLFSLFIIQNICYGYSKKNRLNEMALLSTQNTCLNGWVGKYIHFYTHKISLSGSMNMSCFLLHLQKNLGQ